MKLSGLEKQKIKEILANQLYFTDVEEMTDDTDLRDEMGMDSLDAIELLMEFEKQFNIQIPDNEAEKVKTVSDIFICIENCN